MLIEWKQENASFKKKKKKSWLLSKPNFSSSFKHFLSPVLHRQRAPERGKISTTFPIFGVPDGMDDLLSWYAQNRESNHSTARKYKEEVLEPAIKKTFNAISCLAAVRRGRKLQRKNRRKKRDCSCAQRSLSDNIWPVQKRLGENALLRLWIKEKIVAGKYKSLLCFLPNVITAFNPAKFQKCSFELNFVKRYFWNVVSHNFMIWPPQQTVSQRDTARF